MTSHASPTPLADAGQERAQPAVQLRDDRFLVEDGKDQRKDGSVHRPPIYHRARAAADVQGAPCSRSSSSASLLRLPTFCRPLLSDDEAIYAVTARRDGARRPAVPRRRRSQAAGHLPPLSGRLRRASAPTSTTARTALVILAVLLTAALLFAIARQEAAPARGDRPGGGGAVPDLLDDLARLRRAGRELRAVPAGAAGGRRLAAAARSARVRRGARAGSATHLAVGALIGTSALFKYQGLTFLGASIGMLVWWAILGRASWPGPRRVALCQLAGALAAARALPRLVRARRQRRGRGLLVQVQLLVRRRGPDRAGGGRARACAGRC